MPEAGLCVSLMDLRDSLIDQLPPHWGSQNLDSFVLPRWVAVPSKCLEAKGRDNTLGQWPSLLSTLPAECSVTGDIHFTTFDGRRYTFPASCQYILAKSRSSGTFTVTLQNAPCGLVRGGTPV